MAAGLALAVTWAAAARADVACRGEGPWVQAQLATRPESSEVSSRAEAGHEVGPAGKQTDLPTDPSILNDLRAELARAGIEVCEKKQGPPIASVTWSSGEASPGVLLLGVRDALTGKAMSRSFDVRLVAPKGRSLAIALAIDELLRASWAELDVRNAPPPRTAVPLEVVRSVRPAQAVTELLVLGAGEAYGQGLTLGGFSLGVRHGAWGPFSLLAAVGVRGALARTAEHGTVRANALRASLAASVSLFRSAADTFEGDVFGGLDGSRVSFEPGAEGNASALAASDVALDTVWGLSALVRARSPVGLRVSAGVGVPLRGVSATDEGRVVMSSRSPSLALSAGAALRF